MKAQSQYFALIISNQRMTRNTPVADAALIELVGEIALVEYKVCKITIVEMIKS